MPTERFTPDTAPFEEDELPAWLVRQLEDAARAAELANKNEKTVYKEGDQVGNFLFVRYTKFKNRAMFRCQEMRQAVPVQRLRHQKQEALQVV